MDNKSIVIRYVSELLDNRDPTAVDRWIAPNYRQHNVALKDGPDVLRKMARRLGDGFSSEIHRVIASDDLVAVHGTYRGLGPDPVVVFEVFRLEDSRIVEHWDAFRRYREDTASGRTPTDGPTEVTDLDSTADNRRLATDFVEDVLIAERLDRIGRYVSADRYDQHNPHMADGAEGYVAGLAELAARDRKHVYTKIHRTVAEGNFVLTISEGFRGTVPVAFYDLFRAEGGRLVEHWDAVLAIPDDIPHGNGVF